MQYASPTKVLIPERVGQRLPKQHPVLKEVTRHLLLATPCKVKVGVVWVKRFPSHLAVSSWSGVTEKRKVIH